MKTRYAKLFNLAIPVLMLLLAGCLGKEGDPDFVGDAGVTTPSGNSAPTISGNPPGAIKVGEAYSFIPSASDPDGDSLTFSIENKPNWLDFNSGNGRISGTPTLANVGTFSSIRITVSDGQASASLSGFSVEVTQVATAATTLSWTAPTMKEDGSTLTDLDGYKIHYGKSSGSYTNTIRVDNPSVTTYIVENLSPDTYFFAATAINSSGIESRYSGEAIVSLN